MVQGCGVGVAVAEEWWLMLGSVGWRCVVVQGWGVGVAAEKLKSVLALFGRRVQGVHKNSMAVKQR